MGITFLITCQKSFKNVASVNSKMIHPHFLHNHLILFQSARSPIYPYPYSTTGVSSIERPLMNTSNLPYAQQPNTMVSPMQPPQHPPQQLHSPAFPTNLSTNQDTALPQVCFIILFNRIPIYRFWCAFNEYSFLLSAPAQGIDQYWNEKHSIRSRVKNRTEINEKNMW